MAYWSDDCSSLSGWTINEDVPNSIVSSSGSIYMSPSILTDDDSYISGLLSRGLTVQGDFDVSFDISLPNFVINDYDYAYLSIYLYTDKRDNNRTSYDFNFYSDGVGNYELDLYGENSTYIPPTLTFPFNSILRITRVGTLVTFYTGITQIYQETDTSLFDINSLEIWFGYYPYLYPNKVPEIKLNNIEITADSVLDASIFADITSLTTSSFTHTRGISPTFSSSVYNYTCAVDYLTNSGDIIVNTSNWSTLTINSSPATSGVAFPLTFTYGDNIITIVVTAEDGVTTNTYTIVATRNNSPSTVASLSALSVGSQTLTPTFSSTTYDYGLTSNPAYTVTYRYIYFTRSDPYSIVEINGTPVLTTSSYKANLEVGSNVFNIVVTAEDGTTTNTYTITMIRISPSTVCTLSNLLLSNAFRYDVADYFVLSPTFNSGVYEYTVSGTSIDLGVDIIWTPTSTVSKALIDGMVINYNSNATYRTLKVPLTWGTNIVPIVITAQDGVTTKTYTITFNISDPSYSYTGSGTKADPFQVSTLNDILNMGEYPGINLVSYSSYSGIRRNSSIAWYFKQTANIDLSSISHFTPIDDNFYDYTLDIAKWASYFDGNGYSLSGLSADHTGYTYDTCPSTGLFRSPVTPFDIGHDWSNGSDGYEKIGSIRNVNLTNVNMLIYCGAPLVSNFRVQNSNIASFSNCKSSGIITVLQRSTIFAYNPNRLNYSVGGLFGTFASVRFVYRCSSSVTITCQGHGMGAVEGLIGNLNILTGVSRLEECYTTGDIVWENSSEFDQPDDVYFPNMFAVGGLIGALTSLDNDLYLAQIINCYATGSVDVLAQDCVGGLIGAVFLEGDVFPSGNITNCYSIGKPSVSPSHNYTTTDILGIHYHTMLQGTNIGGLVAYNKDWEYTAWAGLSYGDGKASLITSSYWDSDATGITTYTDEDLEGLPVSTLNLKGGTGNILKLQITSGCTTDGVMQLIIDDIVRSIVLYTTDDTSEKVATKIRNIYLSTNDALIYEIGGTGDTITFSKKSGTLLIDSFSYNFGSTGVTNILTLPSTGVYAGWDFDNVWGIDPTINNGYPHLKWTIPSGAQVSCNSVRLFCSTAVVGSTSFV